MKYQDFCEIMKATVQSLLGDDYNVRLVQTDRLNGLTLMSLVILKKEENIAPNIYLEPFYSEFQVNSQIDIIANKIITKYLLTGQETGLAGLPFTDYNAINNRLFCKLINYDRNHSILNNAPHIKFMDLAVVFCILVKNDSSGYASVTVKNELMDLWAVTVEELYEKALENTPVLFESTVQPMEDVIRGILGAEDQLIEEDNSMDEFISDVLSDQYASCSNSSMFVAGNKNGLGGASWLLQRNELQALSHKLGSSLYILPSSVHELIVVPCSDRISKNALLSMVQEVNSTQVAPEEFLSNNVYLYTMEDDTLLPLF
jgi:hypothetical protein